MHLELRNINATRHRIAGLDGARIAFDVRRGRSVKQIVQRQPTVPIEIGTQPLDVASRLLVNHAYTRGRASTHACCPLLTGVGCEQLSMVEERLHLAINTVCRRLHHQLGGRTAELGQRSRALSVVTNQANASPSGAEGCLDVAGITSFRLVRLSLSKKRSARSSTCAF